VWIVANGKVHWLACQAWGVDVHAQSTATAIIRNIKREHERHDPVLIHNEVHEHCIGLFKPDV
jgi:hypothetical protein